MTSLDDPRAMALVTQPELEAALDSLSREVRDRREGILGPGSTAWHVGGDLAVFLGGGRAALLQLAHPLVAHAVDHHSRTRGDVVGRFQRTFRNVFAMIFGELDEAFTAARRVHAIHTRVHGTIPHAIGSWPAGTRYHANDADALRWVHATLVDSVIVVRERLDGALSDATKDAYTIEMNRFARLFGIPRDKLPASWAEHIIYMEQMIGSGRLAVAPCAKEMAMFLLGRAGPGRQPRLGSIVEAVTASLLPAELARDFGIASTRRSRAGVRAALTALAPLYRRLPGKLVAIPARSEAMRRLAGKPPSRFAAWTERRLFGLTRQVTGTGIL